MSYLALGDSYTIGEGVPDADRWPVQLATALRAEGIDLADPRIIATTGWTTDELASAIDVAEPVGRYDFVSLLIGVNNQYRGRSVAEYRGEFTALLKRAIGFAGGRPERVLVLSIPDWGVTPFAAAQIAQQRGRDARRSPASSMPSMPPRRPSAPSTASRSSTSRRSVASAVASPACSSTTASILRPRCTRNGPRWRCRSRARGCPAADD